MRGGGAFRRRHGGLESGADERRRPPDAAPGPRGPARRQGHGARGAGEPHLHPMGGVARHRLRQGPHHRHAGGRGRARPGLSADRRLARFSGAEPETLAGDQPLSRPALHQRRQSGCADFRLGRHRRAREGGGETRRPAAQSAVRLARPAVRGARHSARGPARGARERAMRRLSPFGRCNGLGGIGKTRLAIEYAWAHAGDYSALLFVRADGEAALNAGLAALAGGRNSRPARKGGARGRGQNRSRASMARGPPDLAPDPRQRRRRTGGRGGRAGSCRG